MRWRILVGSLLGLLTVSGSALAASQPVWQGQFFVTDVTPECGASATIGDFGTAIYKPRLNIFIETLSLFFSRHPYAVAIQPMFGRGLLRGNNIIYQNSVSSQGGFGGQAGNSFLEIEPSGITPTTGDIFIKGGIDDFFQIEKCRISIKAVLSPQP